MNRWFVATLITLALIVLVSPGIVGRLAEKSVEDNLNFAASESDEIVVTTESFERGWFTSEGRHRIELRESSIGALFYDEPDGQFPSLIVETHVDHGLLPVTSLSREISSLKPGLASSVSTIALDPGDGELIELPGKIYSEVGLSGATRSRIVLEKGIRDVDRGNVKWQGADVTVNTNPKSGVISAAGSIQPWTVQYNSPETGSVSLGAVTIAGNYKKSQYGFSVGSVQLEVAELHIANPHGPPVGFEKLNLDASSELDGDRVNAASRLDLSGVRQPDIEGLGIILDLSLHKVDAQSLQNIASAVRDAQTDPMPNNALAELYPLIEGDIQRLLTSGLEVRFDQFDVALPNGELTTKFSFSLPPSDTKSAFSWPALLLALNASADIRLPVELFEMAQEMSSDVDMLVAMGALKKDGDYYQMKAEYAMGLVTINGAPMPIPLQGLQQ